MSEQPSFFEEMKQIIISYFEAKLKLYKIGAYEKLAKILAVLFSSIVITILCFFLLLFLSISGGFYLGTVLNNNALGFLIVFGIYLLLAILVFVFRKQLIEKLIIDRVIQQLFDKEGND